PVRSITLPPAPLVFSEIFPRCGVTTAEAAVAVRRRSKQQATWSP
ncbi:unnamed protein product, partial [Ectocarpus sp. 4 AP-2014]